MKNLPNPSAWGLLLVGSFLALPAGAQLAPLGPETVVASDSALALQCPRVIGHADRSFTVVWSEKSDRGAASILAQRFDGVGAPASEPIDLDAGALAGRYLFDVQAENRGALGDIVTWSSFVVNQENRSWRFDSRLLAAASPARVVTPSYVRQLFPRSVGGYVGVWPVKNGCSFALLDARGRLTSPALKLRGASPGTRCVYAAQATDGSFALDWYHPAPIGANRIQRFGASVFPLSSVNGPQSAHAGSIQLASAPDGRTVLAWVDFNPAPGGLKGPIRAQFFAADGDSPDTAAILATPAAPATPAVSFGPDAVAMNRLGQALVVWDFRPDFQAPNPPAATYNLQLRTPAGAASPILDLGANPIETGGGTFCASAAAAGRTWVVAWRAQMANGDSAIFVRRFSS